MLDTLMIRRIGKAVNQLLKDINFRIGLVMIILLLVISIYGQFFIPRSYTRMGAFKRSMPPQGLNILGTDAFGRDVFALLSYSVVNSLIIGVIAAIIGTTVGSLLGFTSGFYGGVVDAVIRIMTDVMLSIPSLLFLLLIASLIKGSLDLVTVALIISIFSWAWPARQVRSQVLSLKEREFINVATLSGMRRSEIIVYEVMPHMLQWMSANFITTMIVAMLVESYLSILGLGPQNNLSLGMMLYWALNYVSLYRGLWWWWMPPVFSLIVLFLASYLMHIGIDKFVNPRLRKTGG